MCECLLQRHRSEWLAVWYSPLASSLEEVAVSLNIEPQADDPQTGEQLYQRISFTVTKVLGPTSDFPTWESSKGTENSQGVWLWRPMGFGYRTSTDWGNRLLEGTDKTLWAPGSRRKEQWLDMRLSQTCLWVFWSLWWRCGSTVAFCGVRGTEYNSPGSCPVKVLFEGGYCQWGSWPQCKLQGGNTAPPINRKLD